MASDGTVKLDVKIDDSGAEKDLKELEKDVEKSAEEIEKDLEFDAEIDTKKAKENLKDLNEETKKTSKTTEELEKAQKKLSDAITKAEKATRDLEIADIKLNEANLKVKDAQEQVALSTARLDKLNSDTTTSAEELTKAQNDLTLANEKLAKAELTQLQSKNRLIDANNRVTDSNRKVSDSQSEVENATKRTDSAVRILGDTSEKVFGKMGMKAPSTSATIVAAITAIATASYAVVEAVYAMQNAIEIAMAGIYGAILSVAGMITSALDDVASAIIGLGIDPARIEENANAIISLGIAASATGASMEGLAKANVAYYKSILAARDPSKALTGAVEELGLSARDAEGNIKSLAEIIVELEKVVIESGYDAIIVAAIYQIFGASASNLFQIIAFGTENFVELTEKIANTITPEVIAELQEFHNQVSILSVKAKVAVILFAEWAATMAEVWIPQIKSAIQTMVDAIARTKEWWNESSVLNVALDILWQTMVRLHDIMEPIINLIQEVVKMFERWWKESELVNDVLKPMWDLVSNIASAIDNLIDKVFELIEAFQEFRQQDFGSDLVNIGASSQSSTSGASTSSASISGLSTTGFNMSSFTINPNAVLSGSSGGTTTINNIINNWNLSFTKEKGTSPYEHSLELKRLQRGY